MTLSLIPDGARIGVDGNTGQIEVLDTGPDIDGDLDRAVAELAAAPG